MKKKVKISKEDKETGAALYKIRDVSRQNIANLKASLIEQEVINKVLTCEVTQFEAYINKQYKLDPKKKYAIDENDYFVERKEAEAQ